MRDLQEASWRSSSWSVNRAQHDVYGPWKAGRWLDRSRPAGPPIDVTSTEGTTLLELSIPLNGDEASAWAMASLDVRSLGDNAGQSTECITSITVASHTAFAATAKLNGVFDVQHVTGSFAAP